MFQPRHHRYGDVSEQDSLGAGIGANLYAPGDLAPVAVLSFVGDVHPLGPGFFAESRDPAFGAGFAFCFSGPLGVGQLADDRDLFAVDDDGRIAVEPVFGEASGEPFRRAAGVGLMSLLPAAGAAGPAFVVVRVHDYIITPLQVFWNAVHHERTILSLTPRRASLRSWRRNSALSGGATGPVASPDPKEFDFVLDAVETARPREGRLKSPGFA